MRWPCKIGIYFQNLLSCPFLTQNTPGIANWYSMQYSFLGSFCICQGGNFDACLRFAQCDLQALLFIFSRLSDELIIIAFELNSLLTVSHAQFYCLSCTIPSSSFGKTTHPDLMQQLSLTFNFFLQCKYYPKLQQNPLQNFPRAAWQAFSMSSHQLFVFTYNFV